jgi:hypothetical protein
MDCAWIALTEVRFLLVTNQDWLGENSQSLRESITVDKVAANGLMITDNPI